MHEAALSQAALPASKQLLGIPLRPFSLGHELALISRGNTLLTLTDAGFEQMPIEGQAAALIQAVHVCSLDWRGNQQPPRWMRLWYWKMKRNKCLTAGAIAKAVAEFRKYRADGSKSFPADLPSGTGGQLRFIGSPELLRLYQFLISHLPSAEIYQYGASAWDFPYGLCLMLHQSDQENEGNLEIYNYRQKAHDDYVAEEEALRIAEEEAAAKKGAPCPASTP